MSTKGKPRKTTNLDTKKATKPDIMTIKMEMNRHEQNKTKEWLLLLFR